MSYTEIVDLVFFVLSTVLTLLTAYFAFFFLAGVFKKKKFPKTDKKMRYGVVIAARNEESVIGNLIDSVHKNKYPQDKLQVFVIAHNCTDKTAEKARELGATVYEYNNPSEKTKGYALKYLFERVKEDWGVENYDGFFIFDADNILEENCIDKMNDAFVANDCKRIITAYRNSKNFGTNLISALYGIYFLQGCRFEASGRTVLGCSTRVQGTGYVISSEIVKDGWEYVTLTEDWELTADQIIKGNKVVYCDDAICYDEQPVSTKIMLRQRLRWAKGHLLVCLTRYAEILRKFFLAEKHGGGKYKGSLYDFSINICPILIVSIILFFLKPALLAFTPLIDNTVDVASLWTNWAITTGLGVAAYYAATCITALFLMILERKRVKNISVGLQLLAVLFWPFFLFLSFIMEFIAMFVRNVGWKNIPHNDTTTFDNLHK